VLLRYDQERVDVPDSENVVIDIWVALPHQEPTINNTGPLDSRVGSFAVNCAMKPSGFLA
jgi:hypothetical protein